MSLLSIIKGVVIDWCEQRLVDPKVLVYDAHVRHDYSSGMKKTMTHDCQIVSDSIPFRGS